MIWVVALAVTIYSGAALAEDAAPESQDKKWIDRSSKVMDEASKPVTDDYLKDAYEIMMRARQESGVQKRSEIEPTQKNSNIISESTPLIFASTSLPEADMGAVLAEASMSHATVVFRGVMPGQDIAKSFLQIRQMASKYSPAPEIVIDPLLFQKYGVSAVPTVVARSVLGSVSVSGLVSVDWIKKRLADGAEGYLGKVGPTFNIAERDLIDELKDRAARYDWDAAKKRSVENFWAKRKKVTLPVAVKNDSFKFNPSMVVVKDIDDGKGNLIARRGDTYNPLQITPFAKALIIFDASSKAQIEIAQKTLKELPESITPILIASDIESGEGWKSYQKLVNKMGRKVFVLTADLVAGYRLRAVPSIVMRQGDEFLVREIAVPPATGETN